MDIALVIAVILGVTYALYYTKNEVVRRTAWLIVFGLITVRGVVAVSAGEPVELRGLDIPGWVVLTGGVLGLLLHISELVLGLKGEDETPEAEDESVIVSTEKQKTQLVGSECICCGKRIVAAPTANWCERCGEPVHVDCMPDHGCESTD